MHIVIQDDNKNIRTADIGEDVDCVICGSNPDCHVYLPDVRVAERQFRIRRAADQIWRLERCTIPAGSPGEHTRLYVNALEADETLELKHSDEINIARFHLKVFLDEALAGAPMAEAMEEASKLRELPLPAGSIVRTDGFFEVTLPGSAAAALTEFAFAVHECTELASLMSTAVTRLMEHFGARQVWMGARRHGYGRLEFIETRLSDGRTSGEPPLLETYDYRCAERGQFICCVQAEEPGVESAMAIPLVGAHCILGMLYVDNKSDSVPFGDRDIEMLSVMGVAVTKQLELILRGQARYQEAIAAGELSFMRELQSCMDPTNVPQWEGLQLAVYCKPGMESAGDLYDVMRLPNGLASFFCGHVSGAPTTAALAMAEVRASFRLAGLHADPPHVLMRALNWMLHDPKHPAALCSVGLVMNPKTGAMQFATAGKIGAAVIDHHGTLRCLVQPAIPDVGSIRDFAYNSDPGRIHDGDTLVLYSPGCLTVADAKGHSLGEQRFHDALSDGFGQPASAALDELLSDLKAFFREGRQPDDITIMIVHRA